MVGKLDAAGKVVASNTEGLVLLVNTQSELALDLLGRVRVTLEWLVLEILHGAWKQQLDFSIHAMRAPGCIDRERSGRSGQNRKSSTAHVVKV